MGEPIHAVDVFKHNIASVFRRESLDCRVIRVPKRDHVYTCGDSDPSLYFVESGKVKILLLSEDGKECLVAIHTSGDIFGELSLSGQSVRHDTAVAMEDAVLKQIPRRSFLNILKRESLLEGLAQYLSVRIAEQQDVISSLLTANAEKRLVTTLLRLGRRLGKNHPRSILIEQRISHEELAEMVGTSRPRIGIFLKRFRQLGLVEISRERHLVLKEKRMVDYLARLAVIQDGGLESPQQLECELSEPVDETVSPLDLAISAGSLPNACEELPE